MLVGLVVGTAYSTPPLRLKRFPALASLSISGVRSVVVNLGVYAHFSLAFGDGTVSIPAPVWALTLVVMPFSFAIAILKDVPDAEGDRRYRIMTFTVRLGGRPVMQAGIAALVLGYLGMAMLGPLLIDTAQPVVLAGGQLAALALLLVWSRGVDPADQAGFTRFYMRVWKLFFLEYALVALACLAGLAALAQDEERDQGRDAARERDRERRAPLEQRERAARLLGRPAGLEAALGRDGAGRGRRDPGRGGLGRAGALPGVSAASRGELRAAASSAVASSPSASGSAAGTGEPTYLRRRGRSSSSACAPAPSGRTVGDSSCE